MIAVDTNIIVRYLTDDDIHQSFRAREIIENQEIFVSVTVLLELEWVLRKAYQFGRNEIAETLRIFAGMPTVVIEDATIATQALDLLAAGMDFADALHLLKTRHCDSFKTFDRGFVKAAKAAGFQTVMDAG